MSCTMREERSSGINIHVHVPLGGAAAWRRVRTPLGTGLRGTAAWMEPKCTSWG